MADQAHDDQLIPLRDLARVELAPGDVLVVRVAHPITAEQQRVLQDAVQARLPHRNEVLVLWGDVELAVLVAERVGERRA